MLPDIALYQDGFKAMLYRRWGLGIMCCDKGHVTPREAAVCGAAQMRVVLERDAGLWSKEPSR